MNIVDLNKQPLKDFGVVSNLVIGHFGLLHLGHLKLFNKLNDFSFLIFYNNPSKNKTIYTLEERIDNLSKYSPKNIFIYDISKNNREALAFINKILLKINPLNIVVGSDFRFGKDRVGNIDLLKKYFNVITIKRDELYSSSKIISLIENTDIILANKLMLIKFYYSNSVVKGKGLATKFSIPTANIEDNKDINMKSGSYYSVTEIDNKLYNSISFIGKPKTYETDKSMVETHIFDFDKDIYGRQIKVYPLIFIRENQKFNDLNSLTKAIKNDIKKASNYSQETNLNDFKNNIVKEME